MGGMIKATLRQRLPERQYLVLVEMRDCTVGYLILPVVCRLDRFRATRRLAGIVAARIGISRDQAGFFDC